MSERKLMWGDVITLLLGAATMFVLGVVVVYLEAERAEYASPPLCVEGTRRFDEDSLVTVEDNVYDIGLSATFGTVTVFRTGSLSIASPSDAATTFVDMDAEVTTATGATTTHDRCEAGDKWLRCERPEAWYRLASVERIAVVKAGER